MSALLSSHLRPQGAPWEVKGDRQLRWSIGAVAGQGGGRKHRQLRGMLQWPLGLVNPDPTDSNTSARGPSDTQTLQASTRTRSVQRRSVRVVSHIDACASNGRYRSGGSGKKRGREVSC